MSCDRCGCRLVTVRADARFCSTRCRVAWHRAARRLPAVMTGRRTWVRAVGKRPVTVTGRAASSTDPATWDSFEAVRSSSAGDGFGVMLGSGLACWDFDHCIVDGVLDSEVADCIRSLPAVWVERSVSGEGVHVFVQAPEGPGSRKPGVEFYSRARFILVTADRLVV